MFNWLKETIERDFSRVGSSMINKDDLTNLFYVTNSKLNDDDINLMYSQLPSKYFADDREMINWGALLFHYTHKSIAGFENPEDAQRRMREEKQREQFENKRDVMKWKSDLADQKAKTSKHFDTRDMLKDKIKAKMREIIQLEGERNLITSNNKK